jgi:hypothetical protein
MSINREPKPALLNGARINSKEVKPLTAFTAEGGNLVKLKKLASGGYTWDVTVAASSSSVDDLRIAKETALVVAAELERDLLSDAKGGSECEDIPY